MMLRDLAAPTVWRDVAAWVEAGGGPLPSGADARAAEAIAAGAIPTRPRPERIRAGSG